MRIWVTATQYKKNGSCLSRENTEAPEKKNDCWEIPGAIMPGDLKNRDVSYVNIVHLQSWETTSFWCPRTLNKILMCKNVFANVTLAKGPGLTWHRLKKKNFRNEIHKRLKNLKRKKKSRQGYGKKCMPSRNS